ncbi:MAG: hypothetical protein VX874_21310 [Pseudomonadota bacterium]|nr:hypothetical protein [Pseudomonadota bacterium]
MDARLLAFIIITPFFVAFVYAGIHEYLRYKAEGKASYGLVYDEETGTTHVTGISEDQEAYDPEDFDPSEYNDPDVKNVNTSEDEGAEKRRA